MKALILLFLGLQLQAQVLPEPVKLQREIQEPQILCQDQWITYGATAKTLTDVLTDIERETANNGCQLLVSYLPELTDKYLVTIDERLRPFSELMAGILAGTPFEYLVHPSQHIIIYDPNFKP